MDAELIDKAELTEQNSFDQSVGNSLSLGEIRPRPGSIQTLVAVSPKHCDAMSGNRRSNKVTVAMSFLVAWIEHPHAGLDSNLTDQITQTFRTYNP